MGAQTGNQSVISHVFGSSAREFLGRNIQNKKIENSILLCDAYLRPNITKSMWKFSAIASLALDVHQLFSAIYTNFVGKRK